MPATGHNQHAEHWVELRNHRAEIDAVEDRVLDLVDRFSYPRPSRFAIKLSLEEAIINAFKHGHEGLDPATSIRVGYTVAADRVLIFVEDQGPGFTPADVPDPTLDENLANTSGRGLMLMRAYMSEVWHNERGNRVGMLYRRPPDSTP